jgi:aminoglycoside phosphotransferase (APT) family kinase protein
MRVAGRGYHSIAVDIDDRLIAKFPEGEEAEHALRREAAFLAVLAPRLSMNVPRLQLFEAPRLFSLHARIAGMSLTQEVYAALSSASHAAIADDLALFFAELHALPRAMMEEAGAREIGSWDTSDAILPLACEALPGDLHDVARRSLDAYRDLPPDPCGEVYGFFDGHGWNMGFDADAGRLAGILDFADSGFGPLHREFVYPSLIDPDLTLRIMARYEARTGRVLDRARVGCLIGAMRISELAGAVETGVQLDLARHFALDWLRHGFAAPT